MKNNQLYFENLKIIKHDNLEKIINYKIIETNNNNYLFKIDNLIKEFQLKKADCTKSELVAEIFFLSINKIYENEIKKIKLLKEKYEEQLIKKLVYNKTVNKLSDIYIEFEKNYNKKQKINLCEKVSNSLKNTENIMILSDNKMKNILLKLIDDNELINLNQDGMRSISAILFYYQNNI